MKSPRAIAATAVLLTVLSTRAPAQEPQGRTVRVQVTSVSGRDVYLDQGRTAGLETGMVVRLFPPGQGQLDVEVRAVSSSSARAELPAGIAPPPVGTHGEVTVTAPAQEPAPPPPASGQKPVPAHPPWTRQDPQRTPDQPLLVPTYGQRPSERPFTLDGRLFASMQWNRDTGGDRNSETLLSRTGLWSEGHNALGQGERWRVAGEFDDRRVWLIDAPDTSEQDVRLDLASVAFGTEGWAPLGVEAGRFISEHLPELGLVDGVEGVLRCKNGVRLGAGVGSYPLPFPERDAGADLGFHVFADYLADEQRSFAAGVGVQKTWHEGAPDRDLLLLRAEGRPAPGVTLYGNAKVDYYTAGDTRKSSGLQVTEFFGQARYDGRSAGVGLAVSQFRWADLLRQEFANVPDALVRDGYVERLSLSTWWQATEPLRLSARADDWRDQQNHGTAFELAADYRDLLGQGSWLSGAVFTSEGDSLSGPGARLSLRRPFGDVSAEFGYRWYRYEVTDLLSGSESFTRQSVELGLGWAVGNFDLACTASRWFGDQEDGFAIDIFAQWRF